MTLKQKLLRYLLRTEVIDIGKSGFIALGQFANDMPLGTIIHIMESDGIAMKLRFTQKGGIGSMSIEGSSSYLDRKSSLEIIERATGTQHIDCNNPDCPRHGLLERERRVSQAEDGTPSIPAAMAMPETPEIDPWTTKRVAAIPSAMKAIALATKHGWTLNTVRLATRTIQFSQDDAKIDVEWHENEKYRVSLTRTPEVYRDNVNVALLEKLLTKPTA